MKLYLIAALAATLFTLSLPVIAQVGGTDQGVPDVVMTNSTKVSASVTTTTPSLDGTVHVDGTVQHCGGVNVNHSGTIHVVNDNPRIVTHTVNRPVYRTKTVEKVVEKSVPVYVPVPTAAPTPPAPTVNNFVFTTTPATAPAAAPAPTAAETAAKEKSMIGLWIILGLLVAGGIAICIFGIVTSAQTKLAEFTQQGNQSAQLQGALANQIAMAGLNGRQVTGTVSVFPHGGGTVHVQARDDRPAQAANAQQAPPAPPQGAQFSNEAWAAYMAQGQRPAAADRVIVREV